MRPLLVALFFALTVDAASAQRHRDRSFAEAGDLALIVSVEGLDVLRLQPVGGGVGVRYRLANQTVLGASVGLGILSQEVDVGVRYGRDHEEDRVGGMVSLWLEQHVGRRGRPISPFIGAGLQVGASATDWQTDRAGTVCAPDGSCDPIVLTQTDERRTLQVGGALFVGAEVKLARGITLGGAYMLGAQYQTDDYRSEEEVPDADPFVREDETSSLSVSTGTSQLVLSIYL